MPFSLSNWFSSERYHTDCYRKHIKTKAEFGKALEKFLSEDISYEEVKSAIESGLGFLEDEERRQIIKFRIKSAISACTDEDKFGLIERIGMMDNRVAKIAFSEYDLKYSLIPILSNRISTILEEKENAAEKIANLSAICKSSDMLARDFDKILDEMIDSEIRAFSKQEGKTEKDVEAFLEEINNMGIGIELLTSLKSYSELVVPAIIKDLKTKGESHRVNLEESTILFSKGEYAIYAFNDVDAFKSTTHSVTYLESSPTDYFGNSLDSGETEYYEEMDSVGSGALLFSNKALYFENDGGSSFKLKIEDIITAEAGDYKTLHLSTTAKRNNRYTFKDIDAKDALRLLKAIRALSD